jgi:DNA-binding IclR family transcriptional regulator
MAEDAGAAPKIKLVGAVVQAVRLLQVLEASNRPLGVSALAREAKVNPSTAFNILRTLVVEELVVFDELSKTYTLGNGLLRLSRKLISQSLVNDIRPELGRLASETSCLVGLWQVAIDRMILIERALSDKPMRLDMEIKHRLPLMLGAVGRAYAAHQKLTDAQLRDQFKQLRWDDSLEPKEYVRQVRDAEASGYGVDRGSLYSGVWSVGAVITGPDGRPAYGLTASDLASNFDEKRIADIGMRMASLARSFSI